MSDVVSLGYTCVCGERVRVFELKQGQANALPRSVTVACKQGHTSRFTAKQIALLDHLDEPPSEHEAKADKAA